MKRYILLSLLVWMGIGASLQADTLVSGIQYTTQKQILTIESKSFYYDQSSKETITLVGGRSRKFFSPELYWGEAGYAAVLGKRNGYIEGGAIFGFRRSFASTFIVDLGLFVGAAGGGQDDKEGGGFNAQLLLDLGYQFHPSWGLSFQTGYTSFLNGDLNSMIWGLNLSHAFQVLRG